MSFSYYDNNNRQVKTLNLQVGANWQDIETENDFLNTIFKSIDDGDGTVSNIEISMLERFIKNCDKNNNNIFDQNDYESVHDEVRKGRENLYTETVTNLTPEDLTLDVLKKRFPEDKFKITKYEDGSINIEDKNNNIVFSITKCSNFNDKETFINEFNEKGCLMQNSYKNGQLETILINDKYVNASALNLAKNLRGEIYKTNGLGFPMPANIDDLIGQINSDNVLDVLKEYSNLSEDKPNLIIDIMNETSQLRSRKTYILRIKNAIFEHYKQKGVYVDDISSKFDLELELQNGISQFFIKDYFETLLNTLKDREEAISKNNIAPNGQIDENFSQGNTGDCWLLAAIISINNTPKGKEILNNSLKVNDDGSVRVHLKGVNRTYTISKEELIGNTSYVEGDLDVRAIEIAVNKYFYEKNGVNDKQDINGNFEFIAYEILTGESVPAQNIGNDNTGRFGYKINIDDNLINNFNIPNAVITVSSHNNESCQASIMNKENSNIDLSDVDLIHRHAYSVKGSDENNVYLINPHNSAETLVVSREDFKRFFNSYDAMILGTEHRSILETGYTGFSTILEDAREIAAFGF